MRRNLSASRRNFSIFESLENRQLFTSLGVNLIQNPGAESNAGANNTTTVVTPSHWTPNGHPTAAQYATVGVFPTFSSPGPSSRGKEFFAGGPKDAESDLFQTINVSSLASTIDAKEIHYNLSGWLGGTGSQGDNVTLFANFESSGGFISQVSVGPVTPSQRGNAVKLLDKSNSGTLPKGTRSVQIQMHFERESGTYDDGYADNLSFVLTKVAAPTTGTISGEVFNDANGNATLDSSEKGESGWIIYIDSNNNDQYDPGETEVKTNSSGDFTLNLKPGKYTVRVQVRSGYYETSPAKLGYTFTVAAGDSDTEANFGVKTILAGPIIIER